jgi:hypothetical protein
MGAQLATSVHLTDPETHETVILDPGTCPEPRLAALVTNPSAWIDGNLPAEADEDDASGDDSDDSDGADTKQAASAAKKTAAKKTAASSRSRGRDAAGEGNSGD